MAGPNTLEFNEANFETEVLQSDKPVLVDFWAEWCMPCRAIAPIIESLADDFADKAKVGKVDTDANRELALQFEIQSIPTILVIKNGEVILRTQGISPSVKQDLTGAINGALES